MKNIKIRIADRAARANSKICKVKKSSLTTSEFADELSETKRGGMRKPTAAPMIFATNKRDKANDLYINKFIHFLA